MNTEIGSEFEVYTDGAGRPTICGEDVTQFEVVESSYMGFCELIIAISEFGDYQIFNVLKDANLLYRG